MELIVAIASLSYLCYLCIEAIQIRKLRKRLKKVIHINGIRGKSTVSRLVDAGLRSAGYKVFTKTTGTSPRIIDVHNAEREIPRQGKANIREQIQALRWAVRQHADILIVECMAVKPVLQAVCEHAILRSDVTAITNVRADHLDEMGKTLDEIAVSLSNTIPDHAAFFTADAAYFDFFKRQCAPKHTKAFLSGDLQDAYRAIDFPDNVALALDICAYLGADKAKALAAMQTYRKDPGCLKTVSYRNAQNRTLFFINTLAANDPHSTEIILKKAASQEYWHHKRFLLINNRADRMSRLEQYVQFAVAHQKLFDIILISGESKQLFYQRLQPQIGCTNIIIVDNVQYFETLKEDAVIFAAGNICRSGKILADYFERKGTLVYDT
nr:poly-gamma-glutamate synthase PgsB [uncultured Treponema sp.]